LRGSDFCPSQKCIRQFQCCFHASI
jgi:hypothetical protein